MTEMSPLDKSGDIGDDKASEFIHIHNTQVGDKSRERIIGDNRLGGRNLGDQSGFPDVRKTHNPHICDKLQLQDECYLFSWPALLRFSRGLMGGSGKGGIASSSLSTLGRDKLLTGFDKVKQDFPFILLSGYRSDRNLEDRILSSSSVAVPSLSVGSSLSLI